MNEADRNILADDPHSKEFAVFGDARKKLQGEVNTSREMYFAIYQAMDDTEWRPGLYRDYSPDFFDLIIVDECHRGSADEESSWHEILEYFTPAVQVGMTATPLRDDNRDTYAYFGDRNRVDMVLTNPPFGGEEERGIRSNFPEDKQTAETALLFLQFIMRKLRRAPKPGRAGIVVPNGTLFGDGVCARIKEELLKEFNLHTIVRLPNGVLAPYTSIPTNLLFFERGGPTKEIWYYEQPLPPDRKNYTKTRPMQFEEFADCLAWWKKREENERAWRVPVSAVLKYDENGTLISANLDLKNPNRADDYEHMPPQQLVADIAAKERRIAEIMAEITEMLKA